MHHTDELLAQAHGPRSPYLPGPAAAWAVPAGLGLVGSIVGNNSANHAQQQAQQAAQQATDGQNALTQQQMALYQAMLGDYQKNYQPLEPGLAAQMGGQLGSLDMGQLLQQFLGANMPGQTDAATGIPVQQTLQDVVSYLNNPGGTLSGLNGVGGETLAGMQRGAAGGSNLGQITPQMIQQMLGSAAGAQGVGGQVMQGLSQPTNLQALTPGVQQGLLSGGVTGGSPGAPGTGAQALSFYGGEMQNGLDPAVVNSAMGQQQVGFDRQLADVRNMLGGRSNIGAIMSDIGMQDEQSRAQLLSSLAAQNQGVRQQGAAGLFGTGQAMDSQSAQRMIQALAAGGQLDAQTAQNLLSQYGVAQGNNQMAQGAAQGALGAAGGLDQQQLQYLLGAQQTAGGIDAQTMQMLTQAYQLAQQGQNQVLGNFGNAYGAGNTALGNVQNYVGQGRNFLPGVASGIGGIADTYGQRAGQAAGNAAASASQAAATNPFSSLGSILANAPQFGSSGFGGAPTSGYGYGANTAYTNTTGYGSI